MKRKGMHILDFHVPALVDRQLTYLHGQQCLGKPMALCFLPNAELLSAELIDHQADHFRQIGATLLIVNSGLRPLHQWWVDQSDIPRAPILTDPCGRLHRMFGVLPDQSSMRCRTFIIDKGGSLCLCATHDFVDRDLGTLRKLVVMAQQHSDHSLRVGEHITAECLQA